jgi:DNA polymerase-3 subunit epsilon/ATP-dependent DNA helicase DinG
MQPALGFQPEAFEDTMSELEALHAMYGNLMSNGSAAISRPDSEWVSWVATNGSEESATLYAAPIEVGPVLAKELFLKKASVVLTSATLKAGEGFEYIESRVGLEKPRELALQSSFPYQETALLLLPQDLPPPQAPGYYRIMEQALAGLCLASEGRALVLFTSYASLQSAQRALKERLEPGIKVFAQGGGLTVQRMLERLRSQPNTVLLGTSSFWEGVDVVGEALSLLVITRLPFTVPTEPVFQARSERFEDPFGEYAVPQAVLRFRQGFGRLIRSRTDRGVCVVLDPRVGQKRYGQSFLEAIPPATVHRCMLREAPLMVRDWLTAATPPD